MKFWNIFAILTYQFRRNSRRFYRMTSRRTRIDRLKYILIFSFKFIIGARWERNYKNQNMVVNFLKVQLYCPHKLNILNLPGVKDASSSSWASFSWPIKLYFRLPLNASISLQIIIFIRKKSILADFRLSSFLLDALPVGVDHNGLAAGREHQTRPRAVWIIISYFECREGALKFNKNTSRFSGIIYCLRKT